MCRGTNLPIKFLRCERQSGKVVQRRFPCRDCILEHACYYVKGGNEKGGGIPQERGQSPSCGLYDPRLQGGIFLVVLPFQGIILNVIAYCSKFDFIPDDMLEIVPVPDRYSRGSAQGVDPFGGDGFELRQHCTNRPSFQGARSFCRGDPP